MAEKVQVWAERPVMSLLAMIKLGFGVLLCGAAVIGGMRGSDQGVVMLAGLGLLLLVFGGIDMAKVLDRKPQVTLTSEGFVARGLGEVLVPWQAIARAEYLSGGGGASMVRFHLRPEADLPLNFNILALGGAISAPISGARSVQIEVSSLQNGVGTIMAAVARFAPEVERVNWR